MSVQKLPNEILQTIFKMTVSDSDLRDVYNCALVCQSWHLPACSILHEKVTIHKYSLETLLSSAQKRSNLGTFCKVLVFTKKFYYDRHSSPPLTPVEFQQLLEYLPNIKRIELDNFEYREIYLQLLNTHADLLKNVQEIRPTAERFWNDREEKLFNTLITTLKDTIQIIEIFPENSTLSMSDNTLVNVFPFVSEFKALKTLKISHSDFRYSPSFPTFSMFPILRLCPELTSFCVRNSLQEPDDENTGDSFDHEKLKYLDITVPELTRKQIAYMASNITQLKHIKLDTGYLRDDNIELTPAVWMDRVGPDHLNSFQKYLADVNFVDLSINDKIIPNITEYWPFVSGIIQSKPLSLPIHLAITLDELNNGYQAQKIYLRKRWEDALLHYGLDRGEFTSRIESQIPTVGALLPFDFSQVNIQSITLYAQLGMQWKITYKHCLQLLQSAIEVLPNLSYVHLKIKGYLRFIICHIKVGSEELSYDLDYNDDKIDFDMDLPHSPSTLENRLEYVSIQGFSSDMEIRSILEYLPQAKHLALSHIDINSFYSEASLDLGSLRLKSFALNIGPSLNWFEQKQIITVRVGEHIMVARAERNDPLTHRESVSVSWLTSYKNFRIVHHELVNGIQWDKPTKTEDTGIFNININCTRIDEVKLCLNDTYALVKLDSSN